MKETAWHAAVRSISDAGERYGHMVAVLRSQKALPRATIADVLHRAGRTYAELVEDVLTVEALPVQPGGPCESCDGKLVVYASKRGRGRQTQYLQCDRCGWKPRENTRHVPMELIRRRKRKAKPST